MSEQRRCLTCDESFSVKKTTQRFCSHRCAATGGIGVHHQRTLATWNWQADPATIAWREGIVARIDAERAEPAEPSAPAFFCGACGSRTPLAELIQRRRIS